MTKDYAIEIELAQAVPIGVPAAYDFDAAIRTTALESAKKAQESADNAKASADSAKSSANSAKNSADNAKASADRTEEIKEETKVIVEEAKNEINKTVIRIICDILSDKGEITYEESRKHNPGNH